jgi:dipeptidyl aminopeptidase/acylaminoacyl peptidase
MRGCGQSEGTPGRVICLEQVEDTKNALTFLISQPEVDPERIGCFGHSFGAAVAVYTAGAERASISIAALEATGHSIGFWVVHESARVARASPWALGPRE